MPRIPISKEYAEERHDLAHALASNLIAMSSMKESNPDITSSLEKTDFTRWISRGQELINRLTVKQIF